MVFSECCLITSAHEVHIIIFSSNLETHFCKMLIVWVYRPTYNFSDSHPSNFIISVILYGLSFASFGFREKLDPVSRVTGIPGWYWILGIKCSDTTGVGLVYWNGELKSGQRHTPISKHRHAMHASVIFCRVDYLKHCKWSTFLQKEKKSIKCLIQGSNLAVVY